MNAFDTLILYTDASTGAIGGFLMQVQGGREIFSFIRASNYLGGDGVGTIRFCLLCQESPPWYFYSENLVYLSNLTILTLVRSLDSNGSRWTYEDFLAGFRTIVSKIKYYFKDDSTHFSHEKEEVEDENTGDTNEERDEVVALRV